MYQKTLQRVASVSGIGLHSGLPATITFKPAPEYTGIYFVRRDLSGLPSLRASSRNVTATQMATVLGGEIFAVSTVEHCMAAVSALGLDNLVIELDGPELPIGDGSAWPYFDALKSAGIVEQPSLKRFMYIMKPLHFYQGEKYVSILPHQGLRITCTIDFPHPVIGRQSIEVDIHSTSFERELSKARTFGFLKEVEALQKKGLARGGSLENAVVLDDNRVLNPTGLRQPDEFVRHKAMDSIGDLMMAGHAVLGHLVCYKAGHDMMHGFVKKLLSEPSHYRIIELAAPLSESSDLSLFAPKYQFG